MPDREYPLTPGQERMWFLQRLDPEDTSENLATIRTLTGPLDLPALRRAVDAVVARHEPLRTVFTEVDGAPVQRVAERARVEPAVYDLRGGPDPEAAALRAARLRGAEPYPLERGPLLRVELYRTGEQQWVLLVGAHHLVSDGWSIQLLLDELAAGYAAALDGGQPDLPPLTGGYGDHVMWQRARAAGPAADRALAYWSAELAALPGPGLPPGPAPAAPGAPPVVRARVPGELAEAVAELARGRGCTPFMAWLALYQLLIGRHTRQRDVVVGTPTAGRERPEDEPLVGCFTAVLPLRADLGDGVTFHGLLDRARTAVTGALTHPQVPYERLLGVLGTAREAGQRQLFRSWFNLHTEAGPRPGADRPAGGLRLEPVPSDPPPTPFDTSLDAWPGADGLDLVLTCDPAVLDTAGAQALLDRLPLLARAAVARPELPVDELPLLAPGERGALLHGPAADPDDPQDGPADGPADGTVPVMLLRQAERTPDAPAVEHGDRILTYRQLLAAAEQTAARLAEVGALPGRPVGLYGRSSPEVLAGMWGILLAGCGYLPLDPELPPQRLRAMLREAGATAVAAESGAAPQDTGLPTVALPPVALPTVGGPATTTTGDRPAPAPADLAYVLHTSGSTGEPKAVAVPHRALAARVRWMRRSYRLAPGDRVLQFASLGFDTHVEEVFPALTSGATVVLPPVPAAQLLDWLGTPAGRRLTVLDLPTAYWAELVAAAETVPWPPALRLVVLGGDQLPAPAVAAWRQRFGDRVELWNTYGPTEATVIATAAPVGPADAAGRPGIGRPLTETGAYVLDPAGHPVPPGVPGELWLSGAGLADGYLGRPELTAERFTPDPYTPHGGPMYRTGDLARLRPDGTLEFLGRADRQLKVRGHRVEPAEVEAALLRHPEVGQAVVDLHDDQGRQTLAAWVAPRGADTPDPGALRRHLRELLPAHLVPDTCVVLDRMPLTVRGKPDRAALPAPSTRPDTGDRPAPRVEPRTDAEHLVAEVWAEVLGLPAVGALDDFFALGGHSLLATRVVARLRAALGLELPVRTLFTAPTVAGTAAAVEDLLLADIDTLSDAEVAALIEEGDPAR
ncbi:amino acid adenylation domain-containing protein [Streptomyces sp. NPDC092296]|uniref:amino acid adenylation domain-containing protein n=1 Tax=Streptomyces sp. NPDC092296 TaxID=3366012 RepID=UPI00381ADAA1